MKTALALVSGVLLAGTLCLPATAGGVRSDPALLGIPPSVLPSGPGNSAAAKNGGDTNCMGDLASSFDHAGNAPNNPEPGNVPSALSVVMTVATLSTLSPSLQCETIF